MFSVDRNQLLSRRPRPHLDVQLAQLLHLVRAPVSAGRFRFIHFAERETDVDEHVIAILHLGRVLEADLFHDSAKICFAHPHAVASVLISMSFPGIARHMFCLPFARSPNLADRHSVTD